MTLRRQDGKDDVLLRSEIEEMTASGQSLMPEGLEKDLKPQDLADLIAYIASSRRRARKSRVNSHVQANRHPTGRGRAVTSCRSRPGCR